GRRLWIQPVGAHVFDHVAPRLVVRLGRAALRVRDECDRIRALQYEPASRGMHDLAGYGEELDLHLESAPALEMDREHVEKQGAVVLRVHREETTAHLARHPVVQRCEVRRLTAQRRAVIDDLDAELATIVVDLDHPNLETQPERPRRARAVEPFTPSCPLPPSRPRRFLLAMGSSGQPARRSRRPRRASEPHESAYDVARTAASR